VLINAPPALVASMENLPPTPDLTGTCWRDDMFLQVGRGATQVSRVRVYLTCSESYSAYGAKS
jgi:hypothetical protein